MNHRIARTGTCKAILLLIAFFAAGAFADFPTISGKSLNQVDRWSAGGGVSSFQFNYDLLDALEISIQGPARPPGSDMPGEIEFQIYEDSQLEVWAPHGAWDGFAAGGFKHTGNFLIRWPGGMLESDGLTIRPAAPDVLEVVDDSGNALFRLDYIHTMLHLDTPLMTLRNMDIRLTPWLAQRMSHGDLANLSIGGAFIHAPLDIPLGAPDGSEVCGPPNWDNGDDFFTDVELDLLSGVQQVARQAGVRVAIAPSARLKNVGTADVPWYEKFDTPAGGTYPPPYNRDQHPFLVWAMYRIVDEIPQQIGQSAVKHAFFSTNTFCDCRGGNVLWSEVSSPDGIGCRDTYSVSNNNNPNHLGIRAEVPAFTGEWEQCGSIFAPGEDPPGPCTQTYFGAENTDPGFERRLVVEESELQTENATYYFEGWYVIRDDIDIFNTMAHVSVTMSLDSIWTFNEGPHTLGPAIDSWVPPNTSEAMQAHTVELTDNGHYSLAVKVRDLGGGNFRYVYALMNYDFDPKFNALSLRVPAGVSLSNIQFLDGDSEATNDWTSTLENGELTWTAPAGAALEWGFMATFVFEADQAPVDGVVELAAEEKPLSFSPLVLGLTDTFHRDGFEDDN